MDGPVLESTEVLESRVTKQGRSCLRGINFSLSSPTQPATLQSSRVLVSTPPEASSSPIMLGSWAPSASAAVTELEPQAHSPHHAEHSSSLKQTFPGP